MQGNFELSQFDGYVFRQQPESVSIHVVSKPGVVLPSWPLLRSTRQSAMGVQPTHTKLIQKGLRFIVTIRGGSREWTKIKSEFELAVYSSRASQSSIMFTICFHLVMLAG